jgi:hypothetical protein
MAKKMRQPAGKGKRKIGSSSNIAGSKESIQRSTANRAKRTKTKK